MESEAGFSFPGGHLAVSILVAALAFLPIKFAATLAGAKNTSYFHAGWAVVLGVILATVGAEFLGPYITAPLGAGIGFALAIRAVMRTTLTGAIAASIIAVGISVVSFGILVKIGVIQSGYTAANET